MFPSSVNGYRAAVAPVRFGNTTTTNINHLLMNGYIRAKTPSIARDPDKPLPSYIREALETINREFATLSNPANRQTYLNGLLSSLIGAISPGAVMMSYAAMLGSQQPALNPVVADHLAQALPEEIFKFGHFFQYDPTEALKHLMDYIVRDTEGLQKRNGKFLEELLRQIATARTPDMSKPARFVDAKIEMMKQLAKVKHHSATFKQLFEQARQTLPNPNVVRLAQYQDDIEKLMKILMSGAPNATAIPDFAPHKPPSHLREAIWEINYVTDRLPPTEIRDYLNEVVESLTAPSGLPTSAGKLLALVSMLSVGNPMNVYGAATPPEKAGAGALERHAAGRADVRSHPGSSR
jgi:hypothetical protein